MPNLIVKPRKADIFVFGSNEAGVHGAGDAKFAYEQKGARWGKSYGHYGDSFAIPTKNEILDPMPILRIAQYIQGFLAYATGHRKLTFQVTAIGCGLAGFKHSEIAPFFANAPKNCLFDTAWHPWLGDSVSYWGTF